MTREYANVQASLEDALELLKEDWEISRQYREIQQKHPEDPDYERMAHERAIRHVHLQIFVCDLFGVEVGDVIDYELSIRGREC